MLLWTPTGKGYKQWKLSVTIHLFWVAGLNATWLFVQWRLLDRAGLRHILWYYSPFNNLLNLWDHASFFIFGDRYTPWLLTKRRHLSWLEQFESLKQDLVSNASTKVCHMISKVLLNSYNVDHFYRNWISSQTGLFDTKGVNDCHLNLVFYRTRNSPNLASF